MSLRRLVSRPTPFLAIATLGALLACVLAAAPPARAAFSVAFTPSGGTVGTAMTLTSTVSSGTARVGPGKVTYFAGGSVVATSDVDSAGVVSSAAWTPRAAGSVPVYAAYASTDGSQSATSATATVTVAKAPTTTELSMPTTAKLGAPVTITATVKAGTYVPTGSVTFLLPKAIVLTAASLDAKGVASIEVMMPSVPSTYELTARYNADPNTVDSMSKSATTLVTQTGSNVALSLSSATPALGVPVTLTAAVTPATATGTVTFSVGTTVLGSGVVTGGKAGFTWNPSGVGAVTVTASFIPTKETKATGSDSVKVSVVGSLAADSITLGPAGGTAWTPGATYPMRYRSQVTLTATAKSGGVVALAVAGPCALAGLIVTANAGTGSCTLTAKSPGSATLAAATQNYTIVLARGNQNLSLSAQPPPTLRRGTNYPLAPAGTLTSAGFPVNWRVSLGKSRCLVIRQSDGSQVLSARKPGRCNVVASASPTDGQWLALSRVFRFRVVR